jgi:large subunit ribosomal protein L13
LLAGPLILLDIPIPIHKLIVLSKFAPANKMGPSKFGEEMNTKTLVPKQDRQKQKWYVIDAEGKVLGRLATKVATILRGKDSPLFTPHLDMGAYVVVINADKISLTGKKIGTKKYFWHTGYPAGLKEVPVEKMMAQHPERVIERAVKGMLPHNRLGRRLNQKLFIYTGNEHPHGAQKPEKIEI